MKIKQFLFPIFLIGALIFSCTPEPRSSKPKENISDTVVEETPEMRYNSAKEDFEKNHENTYNELISKLDNISDTMVNFPMAHFIEMVYGDPIKSSISMSFSDLKTKTIGNSFIYTLPELDSVDLGDFKNKIMMGNFEVFSKLEFHRAVNYVLGNSQDDRDLRKFRGFEMPQSPSDVDYNTYYRLSKMVTNFSSARYAIVIKHLLSKEPKMNYLAPSKSGTMLAGVVIFDLESNTIVDEFVVEGENTKQFTPDVMVKDNEFERAKSKLRFDLVSNFQETLKLELEKRFTIEGELPIFRYSDRNGNQEAHEDLSIEELIERSKDGRI